MIMENPSTIYTTGEGSGCVSFARAGCEVSQQHKREDT